MRLLIDVVEDIGIVRGTVCIEPPVVDPPNWTAGAYHVFGIALDALGGPLPQFQKQWYTPLRDY